MDESQIITGLKNSDNQAFKQLMELYRQKVFGIALGMTGNYDDATDLAQEVFIEVFRSIDKFRGDAKLSTWIYRIATNKSLNYIRDNKKRKFHKRIDLYDHEKKIPKTEIADERFYQGQAMLENSELGQKIRQAINRLTDNQKTAFVLNKVEGMSYQKVAEVMNVSLSKVESLIFRARKSLQKQLITEREK